MAETFPCLRCVFCNSLFGSLRAANFHLDHFLPEYCVAYETDLAVTASANHPVAAIREFRRKAARKRFISWRRASVQPLDGTTWAFIVPVASELEARTAVRAGLKSSAWWLKRLCAPVPAAGLDDLPARVPAPAPPRTPAPAPARRARVVSGIVNNNVQQNKHPQTHSSVIRKPIDSSTILLATGLGTAGPRMDLDDLEEDEDELAAAPSRRRAPPAPSPSPQHRIRRRRRVNLVPSPVVSPFMKPAAPAPLTTLGIRVFGRVYDVPVTRASGMKDAMRGMELGWLDVDGVGLAPEEGGRAWSEQEWAGCKRMWMGGGKKPEAWVVVVE